MRGRCRWRSWWVVWWWMWWCWWWVWSGWVVWLGVARAVVLGGAVGGAVLLCGSGLVGVVLFGVVVVTPVVGAVLAPVVGGEVVPVVGAAVVRGRRGSRRLGGPLRPGPLPPRRRTLSSPAVARSVVRTPSRMLLAPFSPARLNTGR
ncbi:hypothetical protein [Streptomyces hygroscopicus]|uniref:hypothetical protein n=1 Tax=Streptomyces hygroscopicus TaxID=1912 RepID=UPI000AAD01BD|nr:hypothetical protein [Streptomyces hygroscopicus]